MKRAIPWMLSAILSIALFAYFLEFHRLQTRIGSLSRHTFHNHQDVRNAVIKAHLADATHPIVILGESITEMASFPSELDGKPLINAGIGGATIADSLILLLEY
jgi:hypothetical protein